MKMGVLSFFCFVFVNFSFATSLPPSNLEYSVNSKTSVDLNMFSPQKFLIQIKNMSVISEDLKGKIFIYHKGLLYHGKNTSIYAEGLLENEFKNELNKRTIKFSKSLFIWRWFVPIAFADSEASCEAIPLFDKLGQLNESLKFTDFTTTIKNCDFSISQMFDEQIKSVQKLGSDIYDGRIWSQISNAVKSINEIVPTLYDKLVIPLSDLFSKAPALVNSLVCEFTRKKIGGIVLGAFSGGAGVTAMVVKTSAEINELLQKVSVLQKNKKALELVTQLDRNGKLDKETINRILQMENDLPDFHKNLNVKFRTEENLAKHFERHKGEMGFKSAEEYQEAAKRFVKQNGDANTAVYPLPNGDYNKVNFTTGEMVVTNKYGNIITYFKLSCRHEHEQMLFMLYSKEAPNMGICRDRN